MRPWYIPSAKGVSAGPLIVKCHSNMLSSRGRAKYRGDGCVSSSRTSAMMRFTAGFFRFIAFMLLSKRDGRGVLETYERYSGFDSAIMEQYGRTAVDQIIRRFHSTFLYYSRKCVYQSDLFTMERRSAYR
jgi:hypothetical protein